MADHHGELRALFPGHLELYILLEKVRSGLGITPQHLDLDLARSCGLIVGSPSSPPRALTIGHAPAGAAYIWHRGGVAEQCALLIRGFVA